MKLGKSGVSFRDLVQSQRGTSNVGIVTVTGVSTEIVPQVIGDLELNQWLIVDFTLSMVKGATAGENQIIIAQKAGTAVIRYCNDIIDPRWRWGNQAVGLTFRLSGTVFYRCSAAGSLTIALYGISNGSDSTVGAGAATLHHILLF